MLFQVTDHNICSKLWAKFDYLNECETGFERIIVLVIREFLKYINSSGKLKL